MRNAAAVVVQAAADHPLLQTHHIHSFSQSVRIDEIRFLPLGPWSRPNSHLQLPISRSEQAPFWEMIFLWPGIAKWAVRVSSPDSLPLLPLTALSSRCRSSVAGRHWTRMSRWTSLNYGWQATWQISITWFFRRVPLAPSVQILLNKNNSGHG